MKKLLKYPAAFIFLMIFTGNIYSQNKLPFGDIKIDDLRNITYKQDPGADAVVLSDIGIAALNYDGGEFYVQLVRDVRIRIVNSKGFDYANIEIPFSPDDKLLNYKASTFNLKNNQKTETPIDKKSFIIDFSKTRRTLRFTFPDVHEGSIVEYSYTIDLKNSSVYRLVPWKFQLNIPVAFSSITVLYPEYFTYKHLISGTANTVKNSATRNESFFFGTRVQVNTEIWYTQNVPAFVNEPFIKSRNENMTGINFELASVSFPGSSFEEITPSYQSLTKKLLEREDFGNALSRSSAIGKIGKDLTTGINSDIEKLKVIHKHISENILWNGEEDFTTSAPLSKIYREKRGNSADINLMLIRMLRGAGLKAEPVILSTRSNGSINQFWAIIQQFNYVIARVWAGEEYYLVDATDPLRPFDILPFECLNGSGRIIDLYDSKFIDLKNNEKNESLAIADLIVQPDGIITGKFELKHSNLDAYEYRKVIQLEGEEGYLDLLKENSTETDINNFNIRNIDVKDSSVIQSMSVKIDNGCLIAGERLLFNPFLSFVSEKSPFTQQTRLFPIDFGAPSFNQVILKVKIPEGYSIVETPPDVSFNLGKSDASFSFTCINEGNNLLIKSIIKMDNTVYQPSQYVDIQDFYSKIIRKQSELIVFKKNS